MDNARRKQQLNTRRTTLLASLGRAEQFTQNYVEGDQIQVAVRLDNLDVIWQGLEEVQTELEDLEVTNEGMVRNLQFRANYEPQYFRTKAFLLSKIPPPPTVNVNPAPTVASAAPSALQGLKLPTISLPEFSGDYKDWLAFHDTFLALIHTNPDVADIQKFHYLRAALKGEAAQLIESIGISAVNYPLAWEAIVNRYANEYLLKKRHLQALLESPKMKRESSASLHAIVDDFERHVKILGQLGEQTDSWSTILEHILCSRLHDDTLRAWEDHASNLDNPTYKHLVDFLQRRMRVLESISVNQHHSSSSTSQQTRMTVNAAVASAPMKCYACDQQHPLIKCPTFELLPISEKMDIVNSKRLCLNCFRSNHIARKCSSEYSCRICRRRHHSLLHPAFDDSSSRSDDNQSPSTLGDPLQDSVQTNVTTVDPIPVPVLSVTTPVKPKAEVLLQGSGKAVFMLTVLLKVVDRKGKEHLARALLDCASQPNIISQRMARILNLERSNANVLIHGIGEKPQQAKEAVRTQIRSRREEFSLDIDFLILDKVISPLPTRDVPVDDWNIPDGLFLADPNFHKRSGVDMIIGNEHFFSCFQSAARMHLSDSLPILVDSVFGWIVSGAINTPKGLNEVRCSPITTVSLVAFCEKPELSQHHTEVHRFSKNRLHPQKGNAVPIKPSTHPSTTRRVGGRLKSPEHSCIYKFPAPLPTIPSTSRPTNLGALVHGGGHSGGGHAAVGGRRTFWNAGIGETPESKAPVTRYITNQRSRIPATSRVEGSNETCID